MPTEASKERRKARHAAEKNAKKAARELRIVNPTPQELAASVRLEQMRNVPRGSWLNGKLSKSSQGSRKGRSGENILHAQAEQENHDLSLAKKHTVEYHTTDPNATLPPHVGETLKVVEEGL